MIRLRSKDERRRRAWAYKGNAQVFEIILVPAGLDTLCRPNRVMAQHRSSHRRRRRLGTAVSIMALANHSPRPRPPP